MTAEVDRARDNEIGLKSTYFETAVEHATELETVYDCKVAVKL